MKMGLLLGHRAVHDGTRSSNHVQANVFLGGLLDWCWCGLARTSMDQNFMGTVFGTFPRLPIEQLQHVKGVLIRTRSGLDDVEFMSALMHLGEMQTDRKQEDFYPTNDEGDEMLRADCACSICL